MPDTPTTIAAEARNAMNPVAVELQQVTKTYKLFSSLFDQAADVLGFSKLLTFRPQPARHKALDGINLTIARGDQVGIVGRNGAGKTTLLKLLTGNYTPTSGQIIVNGQVQALMHTGLGFYPEFSGLENLKAALQYNGLTGHDFNEALRDAIEFAELGAFLHQPTKTYSLGMRSRLQFAAATAIKPEILIVDEVLGAGDAYFSGKSAQRMKALTSNGCTLLLVSHSMQQILQFCKRCIWLEQGRIVMDGSTLEVVRAYEEFSRRLEHESALARERGESGNILANSELREELVTAAQWRSSQSKSGATEFDARNVSRWPSDKVGPRIAALRLIGELGQSTRSVKINEAVTFEMQVVAEAPAHGQAKYVIVIYREDGQIATRLISAYLPIPDAPGERLLVRVRLPQVYLGGGRYFLSAAIYERLDLDEPHDARTYDLVSRSFAFTVVALQNDDASLFHHPQLWSAGREDSE